MDKAKVLMNREGKKYLVRDAANDYHSADGFFSTKDLSGKAGKVVSNKGKEYSCFEASFLDLYNKIKRNAQIITLKDIGLIITETGIGKDSVVVDAGAGSGALSCFMAHICKKVTAYELRDDFIELVKKNKETLGLKNFTLKKGSVYTDVTEKNIDVMTLDVPEPWEALGSAKGALKMGGFLVSYSPTIPQVMDFIEAVHKESSFLHLKTVELVQREWEIIERKVRPKTTQTVHTGFLTFVRKI
ncbi:MAG: methyltransferase domain-containing protein [Nanoarchaeota archaeon]|nr:methyltransferase domain-containing protein [Nanoarchaeota archaeon]